MKTNLMTIPRSMALLAASVALSSCAPAAKGPALQDLEHAMASPYADQASTSAAELFSEAKARFDASEAAYRDGDAGSSERLAGLGLIALRTAVAQTRIAAANRRSEEAEALKAKAEEQIGRSEALRAEADERLARKTYETIALSILDKERQRAIADETKRDKRLPKNEAEATHKADQLVSMDAIAQGEMRIAAATLWPVAAATPDPLLAEAETHLDQAREALTKAELDLLHAETVAGLASIERLLARYRANGGAALEKAESSLALGLADAGAQVRRESRGLVFRMPPQAKTGGPDKVAKLLAASAGVRVLVEGFAGTPEAPAKGVKLAEDLCNKARKTLVASGVPETAIQLAPYGPRTPIKPYGDPKAARDNQRVELVVVVSW